MSRKREEISEYTIERPVVVDESVLEEKSTLSAAKRVGLTAPEFRRAAFVQVDYSQVLTAMKKVLEKYKVIVINTRDALRKYPWVKKYYWKALSPGQDEYTTSVEKYGGDGYFIYVPPKTKVPFPILTCLLITRNNLGQLLHNIIIVDEGSELHLMTGCAVSHLVDRALHIGVSEFYVARNAKLTYTMIHAWGSGVDVKPRTGVIVEEGGRYTSYYVIYSPVKHLQTFPRIYLGKEAKAYSVTITVGSGKSVYDVGSRIVLKDVNAVGEIISRNLAEDSSQIIARANITATAPNTKGHIECLGLLLSDNAVIRAIPELESHIHEAELTHEASIGKIAEEELIYLMSKGFTEDEAKTMIIRGFLSVDAPDLPMHVKREIDKVLDLILREAKG